MKKVVIKNIYYVIALCYVFLGTFFLDWSVRMVPFSKETTTLEIWNTLVQDSSYVFVGILLFLATLFSSKNRVAGEALFKLVMFGGLILIVGSSLCIAFINMGQTILLDYIFDIGVDGFLFIPVVILFVNRVKLGGDI